LADIYDDFKGVQLSSLFWLSNILIPVIAAIGIIYVVHIFRELKRIEIHDKKVEEISKYIHHGARVYLKQQYKTMVKLSVVIFILLLFLPSKYISINWPTAVAYLCGSVTSLLAGYIGMEAATMGNGKVVELAKTSTRKAAQLGLKAGLVTGIMAISISILGIWIILLVFDFNVFLVAGFGFGSSFSALFSQVGGGIFTKAADIGADLVGKVEERIPEDDPRNPGVIADNVGDNVGDCAGRSADLYESTSANTIATMILGIYLSVITHNPMFIIFVFIFRACGMIFSTIGVRAIRFNEANSFWSLNKGLIITMLLNVMTVGILSYIYFGPGWYYLFVSAIIGVITSFVIQILVFYYTNYHYRPTKNIVLASDTGPATNVIHGLATGLESTALPVVCFVVVIISAYLLGAHYASSVGYIYGSGPDGKPLLTNFIGGVFSMAITMIGLMMQSCFVLACDTFGPIVDNAAGLAEMGKLEEKVRYNLDLLDSLGNTTKAIAKGFGLTCAVVASFLLFLTYLQETEEIYGTEIFPVLETNHTLIITLANPMNIVGLFVGCMIPFIFSAFTIRAVGRAASNMVREIRRQFNADPKILKGESKPDYGRCIEISTKSAQRGMITPSLIVVIIPIVCGVLFGPLPVAAILIGGTISGILLGMTFNNGGGALDNAKKGIESGEFPGRSKYSASHEAAVIGDTFGDPLKDTAGPSLHIVMKLLNIASIIFIPLFIGLIQIPF
ncbi:MAG: sodium-translocating pyrophosphatase, partial [Promethearchaeota archaeon]